MLFNIKNVNIKISFTFLALVLIFLSLGKGKLFFETILFAIIHEAVHIIFIYVFKGKIESISFNLFGGNIKKELFKCSYLKEAIINISAPLFNLFLALIFKYCNLKELAIINIFLGAFNILPFYSFDGGNTLYCILKQFTTTCKADFVLMFFSVVLVVTLSFFTVYMYFNNQKSVMLFIINLYMLLALIFKK